MMTFFVDCLYSFCFFSSIIFCLRRYMQTWFCRASCPKGKMSRGFGNVVGQQKLRYPKKVSRTLECPNKENNSGDSYHLHGLSHIGGHVLFRPPKGFEESSWRAALLFPGDYPWPPNARFCGDHFASSAWTMTSGQRNRLNPGATLKDVVSLYT